MNQIVRCLLILFITCSCSTDNLPEALSVIPDGIEVHHSEKIVYAEQNFDDPDEAGRYIWKYETTVSTSEPDLQIVEFGAYIWSGSKWEFRTVYNRPFNSEEFEMWYDCPDARLQENSEYTDPSNWSKGDFLNGKESKALWYFIGENSKGERYKGTCEIISSGKMKY
mgnify:CR=1 FL=1